MKLAELAQQKGITLEALEMELIADFPNLEQWDEIPEEALPRINELLTKSRKAGEFQSALAAAPESSNRLATDDDVLAISETTGVDLGVVMQASEKLQSLEALVLWVEAYQEIAAAQEIKDNAERQFRIDQLKKKEQNLSARLTAAFNRKSPNFEEIYQQLGIETPEVATQLATWDGKPEGENEPGFLADARQAFAKIRA